MLHKYTYVSSRQYSTSVHNAKSIWHVILIRILCMIIVVQTMHESQVQDETVQNFDQLFISENPK